MGDNSKKDEIITEQSEYMTLKAVSELSSLPYARVKRDIDSAKLPAYHIGRKYFIKKSDAEKYVEAASAVNDIDGYAIADLLEIIPVSYAFVMGQIKSGKLNAVKKGRAYVIPKDDFAAYIEANKIHK